MSGVKFVTESSRESFKFESISRDLSLFVINLMDQNTCSHLFIVPKRQIQLLAYFLSYEKKCTKMTLNAFATI